MCVHVVLYLHEHTRRIFQLCVKSAIITEKLLLYPNRLSRTESSSDTQLTHEFVSLIFIICTGTKYQIDFTSY